MVRRLIVVLIVVLMACACRRRQSTPAGGAAAADPHEDPSSAPTHDVTTDHGVVRGVVHNDSIAFRGIPYAAARRFAHADDAPRWSAPRDASAWGACCPQIADGKVEGSEDCLTLNVWTPKTASRAPRPVLVFIHGGGNIQGCSAQDNLGQRIYEGDVLAATRDVVVVTMNYRLGVLGFFEHGALGAGATNLGLRDQTLALEWVKRNVAAFGGDPQRVLLFGESAGAEDTCAHVVSPRSKGLFSRALMESAICPRTPLAEQQRAGADIAKKLGCDGADPIACLRAKPLEALVSGAPGTTLFEKGIKYEPVIDGDVIAAPPLATLASGAHNHVPFVIGDNADETLLWTKNKLLPTEAAYRARMTEMLGADKAAQVVARYPASAYGGDAKRAFVAATTDAVFLCPARTLARAISRGQKEPVYRYLFAHHGFRGASHGFELLFVFGHLRPGGYTPTPADEGLSSMMTDYWTRLAAAGDPDAPSRVAWPRYDAATDPYLVIDDTASAAHGLHTDACDFWDRAMPL